MERTFIDNMRAEERRQNTALFNPGEKAPFGVEACRARQGLRVKQEYVEQLIHVLGTPFDMRDKPATAGRAAPLLCHAHTFVSPLSLPSIPGQSLLLLLGRGKNNLSPTLQNTN